MASRVIPDGYQLYQILLNDSDTNHVSFMSFAMPGTIPLMDIITATSIVNSFGTHVMPVLGPQVTASGLNVIYGSPAPPYLSIKFLVAGASGGRSSGSEPQVQLLAAISTETPGRKGRGRIFIPRPDGAQIDSRGRVVSAYATEVYNAIEGFLGELRTTVVAADGPYVLHSHADDAPSVWTSAAITPLIATQRRRLARGRS